MWPIRQGVALSNPSEIPLCNLSTRVRIHRPGEDRGSLIFYGPPGTRKTTLSQQIAKTLQWPLITLSPPYFLQNHGLEGMEVCAAEIFENLLHLRRVVVLFDECEEFFNRQGKGCGVAAAAQRSSKEER